MRRWLGLLGASGLLIAGCSGTPAASHVTPPVPSGWKAVSYHSVQVSVPATWKVVDGMHTGFCEGPFTDTPTAFVGPNQGGASSCGGGPPAPASIPPRDGVWLQPGGARPTDTTPTRTLSGQVLLDVAHDCCGLYREFWYHKVDVQIGIGPDPRLAIRILASVGFTPRARDTPAAGVCPRSAHPNVMPVPERLTQKLVLRRGDFTLDPPQSSDQPVMTATDAWNKADEKSPFEHHRLILTRYSSPTPAVQNPNGSLTPLNQNELAWVIYSEPLTPLVQGCAGWGLRVFDAHSGQEQISAGWEPGP